MASTDNDKELIKNALKTIQSLRKEKEKYTEPVAIVGVGIRLPGGVDDLESLWQLLEGETCTVSEVPSDRWSVDDFYDPDRNAPGKTYTRSGSFVKGHDLFDREFFKISPEEANRMDPMHRLLLESSWHALEESRTLKSELEESRTGIFVGIGLSGYRSGDMSHSSLGSYDATGFSMSFSAGRLSYFLGLNGPSIAVDTACSSSLSALHMAVQSLQSGDCDMALAGGVNLILVPDHYIALSSTGALSPDGKCKAFSANADGYGRGEGCAMLALRPLSVARKRGDEILGVIRSTAMNHDGASSGLTVPNGKSQEKLMKEALSKAGISASSVSYIEAHGTGTDLGDPIEVESIQQVFGRSERTSPLRIGTIKSNIGHLETASGVAGIVKVLASFRHNRLPKSLHSEVLNPKIDWESYPIEVVQEATAWPKGDTPRIAGVSNFGLSGTNVHILLEEPPGQAELSIGNMAPRLSQLVVLSAESRQALSAQVAVLREQVSALDETVLPALCYSLATTRTPFKHRLALVADSTAALLDQLSTIVPRPLPEKGKTAFLYTGQGAQYVGMGKALYDTEPVFRHWMDKCLTLISEAMGTAFAPILFEGEAQLNDTQYTQPGLFALEYSMTRLWQHWGVKPDYLMGHSLGEIVAATVAGIFSLEEGIRLVVARGQLMGSLPSGGSMISVAISKEEVSPYLTGHEAAVSLAGENGPNQIVLSGYSGALGEIAEQLEAAGHKVKTLKTSHAFHSPQMDSIMEPFREIAEELTYHAPTLALVSNVSGTLGSTEMQTPAYWVDHLRKAVLFAGGIQYLEEAGVTRYIEMGPSPVLNHLGIQVVAEESQSNWYHSLARGKREEAVLLENLAGWYTDGGFVDWPAFYEKREQPCIPLPKYEFQRNKYGLGSKPMAPQFTVDDHETFKSSFLSGLLTLPESDQRAQLNDWLTTLLAEIMSVSVSEIHNDQSFIDQGFNSLRLTEVLGKVKQVFSVDIAVKVIYEYSSLEAFAAYLFEQIQSTHKVDPSSVEHSATLITEPEAGQDGALSSMQERLWFLHLLNQGSTEYNVCVELSYHGNLAQNHLETSWNYLVRRHPLLRSVIEEGPQIQTWEQWSPNITWSDFRSLDEKEWADRLKQFKREAEHHEFDFKSPSLHIRVAQTDDAHFKLFIVQHHLFTDGYSNLNLLKEFITVYQAFSTGNSPDLAPLTATYADFVRKEKALINSERSAGARAYWQDKLQGMPRLELPSRNMASKLHAPDLAGGKSYFEFSKYQTAALMGFASMQGVTINTLLFSLYAVLLKRYSGMNDFGIGTVHRNRDMETFAGVQGFFVNTLVWRCVFESNDSFGSFLQRIHQLSIESAEYHDLPYQEVIKAVNDPDNQTVNANLYNAFFSTSIVPDSKNRGAMHGWRAEKLLIDLTISELSKNDLSLNIGLEDGQLKGVFEYRLNRLDPQVVNGMSRHYNALVESVLNEPDVSLNEIDGLLKEERNQILNDFGTGAKKETEEPTVLDLFEEQVSRQPEAVALSYKGEILSYKTFNARVNQLAHYLVKLGIRQEEKVPVLLERSIELVVALWAIMKAGGAYVPIDPANPEQRIAYLLDDLQVPLIVTSSKHAGLIADRSEQKVLLDADAPKVREMQEDNPKISHDSTDLAYVIYTSGSTGQPKGVMVEHGNVLNWMQWANDYFRTGASDTFVQKTVFSFDASNRELIWPFVCGAKLAISEPGTQSDAGYLRQLIEEERVSVIHFVPAMLDAFLEEVKQGDCPSLKHVFCSGEALKVRQLELFKQRFDRAELYHKYGPTEAAISVTCRPVPAKDVSLATLPIGKPNHNTHIYIVDDSGKPVPAGVAGELWIGGDQVARGYLNRQELTAEKFIDSPFIEGDRIYKTGDLARWSVGGEVEFIGRVDHQIKVRGFRIEPGEIESVLRQHALVEQSVVTGYLAENGRKQLAAYVVGSQTLKTEELEKFLLERLPDYMVPQLWLELEAIPLTPSGKVDRKQLPVPLAGHKDYVAPGNPTELTLAKIWQEIFKVDEVSANDNYFALGGDSITSIQIRSRARAEGLDISVNDIFTHQSLASLASVARELKVKSSVDLARGHFPVSPIQSYFFDTHLGNPSHHNQNILIDALKEVSIPALKRTYELLLEHHDELRMGFYEENGRWRQKYGTVSQETFHVEDIDNFEESLSQRTQYWQSRLDISEGVLSRFVVFRCSDRLRLFICIHHLVMDGFSWRIFINNFNTVYRQVSRNKPHQFPAKTTPYGLWIEHLIDWFNGNQSLALKPWQKASGDDPDLLDADKHKPVTWAKPKELTFEMSPEKTTELTDCILAYKMRTEELMMTALLMALDSWYQSDNVNISIQRHGRVSFDDNIDVSQTLGRFTSLYNQYFNLVTGDDPDLWLKSVKEQMRAIPYEGIACGLAQEAGLLSHTPGEVLFNYLGQFDTPWNNEHFALASEAITPVITDHRSSFKIEINGSIQDGGLRLDWHFDAAEYEESVISTLIDGFSKSIDKLIGHCQQNHGYTPSDFPLARLDQNQIDMLQDELKEPIEDIYPLTPVQEGILFHTLMEKETAPYLTQLELVIRGDFRKSTFQKAWELLIDRHSVLRTAILNQTGDTLQAVLRTMVPDLRVYDWTDKSAEEREKARQSLLKSGVEEVFALGKASLMRFDLIRLEHNQARLIWHHHHILFDGWSSAILFRQFLAVYQALEADITPELPAVRPFSDYVQWSLKEAENLEAKEQYWKTKLSGFTTPTMIDFGRTVLASPSYDEERTELPDGLRQALQKYAVENRLTQNTLIQAAWSVLLSRYGNTRDVVFGVTNSGRQIQMTGVEDMVGLFINTLPLRVSVGEEPVSQLLEGIQQQQQADNEYAGTALSDIRNWVGLKPDVPLFDSILVFENYPIEQSLENLTGLPFELTDTGLRQYTNYDLTLTIMANDGLELSLSYRQGKYTQEDIQEILMRFKRILEQLISVNDDLPVNQLDILAEEEKQQLLHDFNAAEANYPKNKTVVDLFEEQVDENPTATALVFGKDQLSYFELNQRVNQLAHGLMNRGVSTGSVVAICVEPSFEMIIGVLAIMKCGAAYVPIDPECPHERIHFIIHDSKACLVLIHNNAAGLEGLETQALFNIDAYLASRGKENVRNPEILTSPDNLAYVIYTSGSTGKPKGVQISHDNLNSYLASASDYTCHQSTSGSYLSLGFHFDASVTSIFLPLVHGKLLVVGSGERDAIYSDPNFLSFRPYSFLKITPAHLYMLESSFEQVKPQDIADKYVIGGEQLREFHIDLIRKHGSATVVNEYGPTETTVGVISQSFQTSGAYISGSSGVAIGKPMGGVKAYILGHGNLLLPAGVPGNLWVGGTQLGIGYLNLHELTAERFLDNPFGEGRIYNTGDLARWLPDGSIEFLGRGDDQVKIRGFRIEPGEIETVLQGHDAIEQAVVMARGKNDGSKHLVTYIVGNQDTDQNILEAYLMDFLPEYMIPRQWIWLDMVPLSPNGKIDRKALPEPEAISRNTVYTAPGNRQEEKIAEIWQELLGVERIGIHDDFFDLGGQSLLAIRLISKIRSVFNVEVPVNEIFSHTSIKALSGLIDEKNYDTRFPTIRPAIRPEKIPLSFAQERLWFLDQLDGSVEYHMPGLIKITGKPDLEVIEKAFRSLVERHEILRTVIKQQDGKAYQEVLAPDQWLLRKETVEGEESLAVRVAEVISEPFDLEQDYALRAALFSPGEEEHRLLIVIHHIASDGWSESILVKEFLQIYEALAAGHAPDLPAMGLQYADYALWQRQYLEGAVLEDQLGYWKSQLQDLEPLELPTDYVRSADSHNSGSVHHSCIDASLTKGLRELSDRSGSTLFMTLLAAFKTLMHRYSGQSDISVGTVVANRGQSEIEALIGFFANTLVLRSNVKNNESFETLLSQIKQTCLEAYDHQQAPFEKVVDTVAKDRDMSRSPLFQVMFDLQNNETLPDLTLPGLDLELETLEQTTAKFDLHLSARESGDGILCKWVYSTELFSSVTIDRLAGHFQNLLSAILEDAAMPLSNLNLLSASEEAQLLNEFQGATRDYPTGKTVVSLFEEQAESKPDEVAVVFGDRQLTFRQLNEQSNRLAHHLISEYKIKSDDIIGICVSRSVEMVIACLGVWKSGAAFSPFDPGLPGDRLAFMMQDSSAILTITDEFTRESGVDGVLLSSALETKECRNPKSVIPESALAYVIYTSGTTGRPKGVMVEHGSLMNMTLAWADHFGWNHHPVNLLQIARMSFDISVGDLCRSILMGGKLVIAAEEDRTEISVLAELIRTQEVSAFHFTPALVVPLMKSLANRPEVYSRLRWVILGADTVALDDFGWMLEFFTDKGIGVVNTYGPTETAIDTTCYLTDPSALPKQGSTPIGKPYNNNQVYILDEGMSLQPVGLVGELHIGGAQVGRGYLNQPALTAEKFVSNPFQEGRLYKTGDLARWLPDGNIEFLGRKDDQVKVQGFRIELSEIESALQQHEAVKQSVVVASQNAGGHKQLVSYVVSVNGFDKEVLTSYLHKHLPDYMVPKKWVNLDEIPLTPNGKVDKKALRQIDVAPDIAETYVAPRNSREKVLAEIWQNVLAVERVGVHDNFFELGGDSIISIQVVSRARTAGLGLKVKDLFNHHTVASLAQAVSDVKQIKADQSLLTGSFELSPIQDAFFRAGHHLPHHYNQSVLLRLPAKANASALAASLKDLLEHHDSLRFRFEKDQQTYGPRPDFIPFHEESVADFDDSLTARINHWHVGMNLEAGALTSMVLFHCEKEQESRLFWTIHHLAVDGVSWRILLEDLDMAYKAYIVGKSPELPAKTSSYGDWVKSLREWADTAGPTEFDYWHKLPQRLPSLPLDADRADNSEVEVKEQLLKLDKERTTTLLHGIHSYGLGTDELLIAALILALRDWTGHHAFLIDQESHGRVSKSEEIEISRTVGWFTSLYSSYFDISGCDTPDKVLKTVKEQQRAIPDEGIGYGLLRQQGVKLPEGHVLFNYLGQFDSAFQSDHFQMAGESTGSNHGGKTRQHQLEINGLVVSEMLSLKFEYNAACHEDVTISSLVESFEKHIDSLLSQCKESYGYSPSDFPLAGLNQKALDKLVGIHKDNIEDIYVLSPMQDGILFTTLMNEQFDPYLGSLELVLQGEINTDLFKKCWEQLLIRHGVLRTAFTMTPKGNRQLVLKKIDLDYHVHDWESKTAEGLASSKQQLLSDIRGSVFALNKGGLVRIDLIKEGPDLCRFVWHFHHLLTDAWTIAVLLKEMLQLYRLAIQGKALNLQPSRPYVDYIKWVMSHQNSHAGKDYWTAKLRGMNRTTKVPPGTTSQHLSGFDAINQSLDEATSTLLMGYAEEQRITLNTLSLAAWSVILAQYSGSNDVVFGVVNSGRPSDLDGVEDMVGLFINTLPMRINVSEVGKDGFFEGIQNQQQNDNQHTYVSLADIQRWSHSTMGTKLFDTTVVFQKAPMDEELKALNNLPFRKKSVDSLEFTAMKREENDEDEIYALILYITEDKGRVSYRLSFDAGRYLPREAQSILDNFIKIITRLTSIRHSAD